MKNNEKMLKKVAQVGLKSAIASGKSASLFTFHQVKEPKGLEKYLEKK
jgi:cyclic lactone autoinducer peptide